MLRATKPFKDKVNYYEEEPSLRIGRTVPEDAVNLAYYYNPTATDAEKVLCAEAPRVTIDHRIEEDYRYLLNMPTDDDNQFPNYIEYEDEEGYSGLLGRMFVNWYPEVHTDVKNHQEDRIFEVTDKNAIDKAIQYPEDSEGYSGTLYLDSKDYEVLHSKEIKETHIVTREIHDYELNYHEIFGDYCDTTAINTWRNKPTAKSNTWPTQFSVLGSNNNYHVKIPNGNGKVKKKIESNGTSMFDEAIGTLKCTEVRYEPVLGGYGNLEGREEIYPKFCKFKVFERGGEAEGQEAYDDLCEALGRESLVFLAEYDDTKAKYDYTDIEEFFSICESHDVTKQSGYDEIQTYMTDGNVDIAIFPQKIVTMEGGEVNNNSSSETRYNIVWKGVVRYNGEPGYWRYDITANYAGTLEKAITTKRYEADKYQVIGHYNGLVRKIWYDYDGMAYYRGSVTKSKGIGSVNDELDNTLLMYSDEEGFLRRIIKKAVEKTNNNGQIYYEYEWKSFYHIESDQVYITDVFKDNKPCWYKYPLKNPIYDYRGPDQYGFYEGNAASVHTSSMKDLPEDYAYAIKLSPLDYETITKKDIKTNAITSKVVPMRYQADLYTSFISNSTDTFQVTYNAFDDNDNNNIALENGVIEDIYGYPFMRRNIDYRLIEVDEKSRMNKIKLPEPRRIEDTRRYISFSWHITAEKKKDGSNPKRVFNTNIRYSSILNKDYAVESEESKFVNRAMIISPFKEQYYQSPLDIVLEDESYQTSSSQPYITSKNYTEFTFKVVIDSITETHPDGTTLTTEDLESPINTISNGLVNAYCNSDGSGYVLAETTMDTGFFNESTGTYTTKLNISNPYWVETDVTTTNNNQHRTGYIYPGFMVMCLDTKQIKIAAPKEEKLLESWYPLIQFGHYSQVMDQYGTHQKVCYTMPEYNDQFFSELYGRPFITVRDEPVEILNSHMVKVKNTPLVVTEPGVNKEIFYSDDRGKIYKYYEYNKTKKDAEEFCEAVGGKLAKHNNVNELSKINEICTQYNITYNWNNKQNGDVLNGFVCEFDSFGTKIYKRIGSKKTNDLEIIELSVKDVSFSDGVVILNDAVSENDDIIAKYTYIEEFYVYRGYWRNKVDFVRIDLNPNKYHTYSDPVYTPSETKPSKNLFNKVIYFFMKPTVEYEVPQNYDDLIYDEANDAFAEFTETYSTEGGCLYHQIDNYEPLDKHDIYIGSVFIRQNCSLHSTILTDARTRGGGIVEEMKDELRVVLQEETDFYLDIGYYDGKPYQENGVIIIRLDKKILKEFGGRFEVSDVEKRVKDWMGYGNYPIIEFVDAFTERDLPQQTLMVEDEYLNIIDYDPDFFVECVDETEYNEENNEVGEP